MYYPRPVVRFIEAIVTRSTLTAKCTMWQGFSIVEGTCGMCWVPVLTAVLDEVCPLPIRAAAAEAAGKGK